VRRLAAFLLALTIANAAQLGARLSAAGLPVPCSAGACGASGPLTWVSAGNATATSVGNQLTINQSSSSAILNWASFNIDAGGIVRFVQPSTSSIALNRIFQASPSLIFGQLTANGQIYLVNPNGLVFGSTAKVSAAGILASTLGISDSVFTNGLLSAVGNGQPALASDGRLSVIDNNGKPVLGPNGQPLPIQLVVQNGAQLSTNQPNGRILLAGQEVQNAGSISAPDGQIILAAGDQVFLQASTDPALRGLLVEVDAGGIAWNQLTGQLDSPRGDITMVGLAVNQDGRVSASTTVAANGSIRLLARDTVTVTTGPSGTTMVATNGGSLTLGTGSTTEVLPELSDPGTAVGDQVQLPSSVELTGQRIDINSGSHITAPGGNLTVSAATNPASLNAVTDPLAQIQVASGASIDLAGSDAVLPVSDNLVQVQLRANELRNSPDQRNGPLRGMTVTVDARAGTPIADVSGAVAAIPENIAQRTSVGGTAIFSSNGSIDVAQGATINVSGGMTTFTGANVATSQLITADGHLVDISQANESTLYVGVLNPTISVIHDRWGVIQTFADLGSTHYEAGYVYGSSAGTIQFQAPALAMDGTLLAHAVNGPYQRDPTSPLYAQGGNLIIGSSLGTNGDFRAPDVILAETASTAASAMPTPDTALTLAMNQLVDGGFTRFGIWSNGTVTLPVDGPLSLSDGSTLTLRGNRIEVLSNITDQGGTIDAGTITTINTATAMARTGIGVGPDVTLDVRGTWINDTQVLEPDRPSAPLFENGGNIRLSSSNFNSELQLSNGVTLLADGGAWINRSATIQGGKGGAISILSNGRNSALQVGTDTRVEAFGVNSAAGGTLSLAAGRLLIGSGDTWATAQSYDPTAAKPAQYFVVGSSLFSGLGFATFSMTATGGTDASLGNALEIAPGTGINALAGTWLLSDQAASFASAGTVAAFATPTTLPLYARNPTSITFAVAPWSGFVGGRLGNLDVANGASISSDPKSSISLNAVNGAIEIDGALNAPGGSLSARIDPPKVDTVGYEPDLQIIVGGTAVLDASGTSIYQPNQTGLLNGSVLAGGNISLTANRGAIAVAPGAILNVSGTAAALDIRTGTTTPTYVREQVASNAGAISLLASESISLGGALIAHAGVGNSGQAFGGTLSVQLTRDSADIFNNPLLGGTFPTTPRTIELTDTAGIPSSNGVVPLDVQQMVAAGFDSLAVRADALATIDSGVQLSLGRRLTIDAPAISISGAGTSSLSAPIVSLGYSKPLESTAIAGGGAGTLRVNADFIDLFGSTVLENIAAATLASAGDIQLRGTVRTANIVGDFGAQGDLTLSAARLYATTASQFAISAPGYSVNIIQTGKSPGVPLSAASAITVSAANITQGGTLLAPFGQINLDATGNLTLRAGSLTSVSGAGALIPYGQTVNGVSWVYDPGTASPLNITQTPGRQVALSGASVTIAKGATVDISGGGDLHAFEWVKGEGGDIDVLAGSTYYAIVPAMGTQVPAYDAQDFQGSSLLPGDTVYLSGGGGVAPGYYALLPARYALLPGAYLISPVSGTTDLPPGSLATLPDGTPVVSGYYSFRSSGLGGTRTQGFSVSPGSEAHQLAQYNDTYASSFFQTSPSRTADAGELVLNATMQLSALGTVNTAPAPGGAGAGIQISAADLTIVGAGAPKVTSGVELQADVLNGWNASKLLIGGEKSADGTSIDVTADSVTVDDGARLTADEVVLVAQSKVTVTGDSSIASRSAGGATPPASLPYSEVALTGTAAPAAVLAVSDLEELVPERAAGAIGTGGQVVIDAQSGALTRGALTIDAPGGTQLAGTLGGTRARWAIGGDQVIVGGTGPAGSVSLTSSVLSQLQSASALRLAGTNSIDFASAVTIGSAATPLESLNIVTGTLDNSGAQSVNLYAKQIVMQGLAPTAVPAAAPGQGNLNLVGQDIALGGLALNVDGFAGTVLRASEQITGLGSTLLAVNGQLQLDAALLSAGLAANATVQATGDVLINPVTSTSELPAPALGGALTIAGQNITDNGRIAAPSGLVALNASDAITMGGGALIDVSGATVTAAGKQVTSGGGEIDLHAGGSLSTASGSKLNVAGAGTADAGRIVAVAGGTTSLGGKLVGSVASNGRGGAFDLQTQQLSNFGALNANLNSGGFTDAQLIHVAEGDLTLAAGTVTRAHDVALITDQGSVTVDGEIDAPGNAVRSTIELYASNSVTLASGGALHADGDSTHGRGGEIELGVGPTGTIALDAGSVISAAGIEPGGLRLRAPTVGGDDIAITALDADVSRAGAITLEAVLPAFNVPGAPTAADYASYAAAASAYISAATSVIQARLDPLNRVNYQLQPGVELQRSGDLDLGALDLSTWRFNGAPAALTVRATGNVKVVGTISDGFVSDGTGMPGSTDLIAGVSSTIRIVAGSDLLASDPLSLDATTAADLLIAPGVLLRTGTGELDLAASRDVIMYGGASVYTGGIPAIPTMHAVTGEGASFPIEGGGVNIHALRDVDGTPLVQSVTAWLTRLGSSTQPVSWGTDISQFGWNLGSLGGGDVRVQAGRDITNLTAATADGATVAADLAHITYYGGGSMQLHAGLDINGGVFYVARGSGELTANGVVQPSYGWTYSGAPLAPFLYVGDAQLQVDARAGVAISGVVNPAVLRSASLSGRSPYFLTYGPESLLDMESPGGNVYFSELSSTFGSFLGDVVAGGSAAGLYAMPANLRAVADAGDVDITGTGFLAPSNTGQLTLFAARDVVGIDSPLLSMSDAPAATVPTPFAPQSSALTDQLSLSAAGARHLTDPVPASVTAGRDITGLSLSLAKAVEVTAGRDILESSISAQNMPASDLTEIIAGRDLVYTGNGGGISVGGSGRLDILAGRNVNLGVSGGIVTTGNLRNANLPSSDGAALTVLAGVAPGLDYVGFVTDIVAKNDAGAQALVTYMESVLGTTGLTLNQALSAYKAAPPEVQRPLALQQFFVELVASGREANAGTGAGFARGYAAIDALLPDSRSASNPYLGDINLDFSRIYTLAGGTITLLAPGGLVNVGLAVPPANAAARSPSDLGIVAQKAGSVDIYTDGDVLVNASRIFTLLGGDIAIWSTLGNIDAGRGAKSSLSAPPPTVLVDSQGNVQLDFSGAIAGSGIRTIATSASVPPGNVDLIAPVGFVNAGDAGIGASGNINIAAKQVIGADNIQFSGTATGVPAATSGLGASLSAVSAVASSVNTATAEAVSPESQAESSKSPLAESALSWLEVTVLGLGEESCRQDDLECLKRQKH
jgi:filamentous hemagglutinin family protein